MFTGISCISLVFFEEKLWNISQFIIVLVILTLPLWRVLEEKQVSRVSQQLETYTALLFRKNSFTLI